MITLSHTALSSWRRCRYQYYLRYSQNYVSGSGDGQIRGSAGHAALASWYKFGSEKLALNAAYETLKSMESAAGRELDNEWDRLSRIIERYITWSLRNDRFAIFSINDKPAIELEVKLEIDGLPMKAIIDGIVSIQDELWILEHKFVSKVNTRVVDLDWQISLYHLILKLMGYPIKGVLYNVIRTTIGGIAETQPVVRLPTFRSEAGLKVIEVEVSRQMKELERFWEGDDIPIYRNITRDCNWDCGFFNACLAINDVGSPESVLRNFVKYSGHQEKIDVDQEES